MESAWRDRGKPRENSVAGALAEISTEHAQITGLSCHRIAELLGNMCSDD